MQFTHESRVAVEAAPQDIFAHWSDAKFLPKALSHIRATALSEEEDLARLVIVLEGRHFEFAVQRTMCGENTICWQSLGTDFGYILTVALQSSSKTETCITVNVSYDPPGFLIDMLECLGVKRVFKHALESDMTRYATEFHFASAPLKSDRELAAVD